MIDSTRIVMAVYSTLCLVQVHAEQQRSFRAMKTIKVLLMPTLVLYLSRIKGIFKHCSIQLLAAGLVFATVGDYYMLQFDLAGAPPRSSPDDPFVRAIASFIAMHVCYAAAFLLVPRKRTTGYISGNSGSKVLAAAAIISIAALQHLVLKDTIKDTRLESCVIVYGVFVTMTVLLGIDSLSIFRNGESGRYCCTGTALFALSDAIICTTTFSVFGAKPNRYIYALIMLLYVTAQGVIVIGLSSGVKSNSKWRRKLD